jgi:hypothetical protein
MNQFSLITLSLSQRALPNSLLSMVLTITVPNQKMVRKEMKISKHQFIEKLEAM